LGALEDDINEGKDNLNYLAQHMIPRLIDITIKEAGHQIPLTFSNKKRKLFLR
jgi:hypothetical protein